MHHGVHPHALYREDRAPPGVLHYGGMAPMAYYSQPPAAASNTQHASQHHHRQTMMSHEIPTSAWATPANNVPGGYIQGHINSAAQWWQQQHSGHHPPGLDYANMTHAHVNHFGRGDHLQRINTPAMWHALRDVARSSVSTESDEHSTDEGSDQDEPACNAICTGSAEPSSELFTDVPRLVNRKPLIDGKCAAVAFLLGVGQSREGSRKRRKCSADTPLSSTKEPPSPAEGAEGGMALPQANSISVTPPPLPPSREQGHKAPAPSDKKHAPLKSVPVCKPCAPARPPASQTMSIGAAGSKDTASSTAAAGATHATAAKGSPQHVFGLAPTPAHYSIDGAKRAEATCTIQHRPVQPKKVKPVTAKATHQRPVAGVLPSAPDTSSSSSTNSPPTSTDIADTAGPSNTAALNVTLTSVVDPGITRRFKGMAAGASFLHASPTDLYKNWRTNTPCKGWWIHYAPKQAKKKQPAENSPQQPTEAERKQAPTPAPAPSIREKKTPIEARTRTKAMRPRQRQQQQQTRHQPGNALPNPNLAGNTGDSTALKVTLTSFADASTILRFKSMSAASTFLRVSPTDLYKGWHANTPCKEYHVHYVPQQRNVRQIHQAKSVRKAQRGGGASAKRQRVFSNTSRAKTATKPAASSVAVCTPLRNGVGGVPLALELMLETTLTTTVAGVFVENSREYADPISLTVDTRTDNIIIADGSNNCVRQITATGVSVRSNPGTWLGTVYRILRYIYMYTSGLVSLSFEAVTVIGTMQIVQVGVVFDMIYSSCVSSPGSCAAARERGV